MRVECKKKGDLSLSPAFTADIEPAALDTRRASVWRKRARARTNWPPLLFYGGGHSGLLSRSPPLELDKCVSSRHVTSAPIMAGRHWGRGAAGANSERDTYESVRRSGVASLLGPEELACYIYKATAKPSYGILLWNPQLSVKNFPDIMYRFLNRASWIRLS